MFKSQTNEPSIGAPAVSWAIPQSFGVQDANPGKLYSIAPIDTSDSGGNTPSWIFQSHFSAPAKPAFFILLMCLNAECKSDALDPVYSHSWLCFSASTLWSKML